MLRLHKRRNFTSDKIIKIFTTWTHPDDLDAFIQTTWNEMPDRGLMHLILTVAWAYITNDPTNKPDPGTIVADPRVAARRVSKEKIKQILMAIQLTTEMITIYGAESSFDMLAPPDSILEAMVKEFDDLKSGKSKG